MNRYPFLAVEGLDGTGKTTLRKGLFRLFEGLYTVTPLAVLTTNYLAADAVPDLVEGKYRPTEENADRYLAALAADKQATAAQLVQPSLPLRPVIADRWLLSELAFFAVKHDRTPGDTYAALAGTIPVVPDLTLVLDLDPDVTLERAGARSGDATRDNWDVPEIQSRVHEIYQNVSRQPEAFPALGPMAALDAAQDRAHVLHTAWRTPEHHRLMRAGDPSEATI